MSDRAKPDRDAPNARLGPIRRRVLVRALSTDGALAGAARTIVRRDATLLAAYDDARAIEALASGSALGTAERALVRSRVLDETARAPASRARRPALVGLSFAAATAAVVLVVARPVDDDVLEPMARDALVARGVESAPPMLGVRARCLDKDGARVVDVGEAGPRAPLGALRCPTDGLLSFAFTNLGERAAHAFVVGLADDDVRWYAPFLAQSSSIEVPAGARDQLVSTLADTGALSDVAHVTLYALFSDEAFDAVTVRNALLRAKERGLLSTSLDRLPVPVAWQARIEVSIVDDGADP